MEGLERLSGLPGRVLMESADGSGPTLLSAAPPLRLAGGLAGVTCTVAPAGQVPAPLQGLLEPFEALDRALDWSAGMESGPVAGRWMGYLAYELGGSLEVLPTPPPPDLPLPDLWFGAHDWVVVWDGPGAPPRLEGLPLPGMELAVHRRRLRAVTVLLQGGDGAADECEGAAGKVEEDSGAMQWSAALSCLLEGAATEPLGPGLPPAPSPASPRTSLPRPTFEAGVRELQGRIRDGDIFQANLTHRIEARWPGSSVELHARLRERSPAPWAAFLEVGSDAAVSSISPESFLSVDGRQVRTRPIKGTAPRSPDPHIDRAGGTALLASGKDRAENIMITDLLRNDLSAVSEPGSVQVGRLAQLESHPTVHHLVSDIEARLRPEVTVVDLLRAAFPGGSITGAPKLRAMELLAGLEPCRRGVYTGSIGWMDWTGARARFSIAIRTAVHVGQRVVYGTGGGITLDSDPAAEWTETIHKARAFLDVLGADAADREALELPQAPDPPGAPHASDPPHAPQAPAPPHVPEEGSP